MLFLSTHLAGPRRRAACEHRRPSLEADSRGQQSTYEAMGSLIAVNLPDGRLIEYVTDGKGRRIGKMVNGVITKQWLYRDQLKPVAELDGSGTLVSEFIYGTKSNVPDLVVRGGVTYRVVSDQLGSPVLAVNSTNSSDTAFQGTYSAFGDRTLVAGADDWMPFGFAGGSYDPDTRLTRFGARDYDASIGRWVSKDPVGFKGRQANLYVYVGNDPVNKVDLRGTWYEEACMASVWVGCRQGCQKGATFGARALCGTLCNAAGKYMFCKWHEPGEPDSPSDGGSCSATPPEPDPEPDNSCDSSNSSCE
jgi:RHS repeat-associated protein